MNLPKMGIMYALYIYHVLYDPNNICLISWYVCVTLHCCITACFKVYATQATHYVYCWSLACCGVCIWQMSHKPNRQSKRAWLNQKLTASMQTSPVQIFKDQIFQHFLPNFSCVSFSLIRIVHTMPFTSNAFAYVKLTCGSLNIL